MKKSCYIFILGILGIVGGKSALIAQQTGDIFYDQLGIGFTIPAGWVGQEANGMYLMGSHTIPGLLLVMPQESPSVESLKTDLSNGYTDAMGTNLMPVDGLTDLGRQSFGTVYAGTLEGQPAKGYVIGAFNSLGQEVYVLAVTLADRYTDAHETAAKAVWKSLRFEAPKVVQSTATNTGAAPKGWDWKYELSGVKLTYKESYYSSTYSDGGISGGYEINNVFDLCPAGYFVYYGSNNMSAGGHSSTAYSSGSNQGSGTWDVNEKNGQAVLTLQFNNGEVWTYNLEWKDKKLWMNGKRYFRTWTGDYAPSCR